VVREGGMRVERAGPDMRLAGTRQQAGAGKRAMVAIRPEELALGDGPNGVNTITARVDNVEYCGRDSLVDVITAGGTRLHVRATASPNLGDEVRIHAAPERVLVYPATLA